MNYPYLIPGVQTDPASFAANTTLRLGSVDKPVDARILVTVGYTGIAPADTVVSVTHRVKPGGEPQLWVENSLLDTPKTTLTFYINGGIEGRTYDIAITAKLTSGAVRTDTMTVNVLGDGCECNALPVPVYPDNVVSGDGSVIVNSAPRYFISNTPPIGANIMDQWYQTSTGLVYLFVTDGRVSSWRQGGGSGGGIVYSPRMIKMSSLTPNGILTQFTMAAVNGSTTVAITDVNALFVSVDGVWQEPSVQFTASDNLITFAQAPSADSIVFILWLYSGA